MILRENCVRHTGTTPSSHPMEAQEIPLNWGMCTTYLRKILLSERQEGVRKPEGKKTKSLIWRNGERSFSIDREKNVCSVSLWYKVVCRPLLRLCASCLTYVQQL